MQLEKLESDLTLELGVVSQIDLTHTVMEVL